VLRQYPLPEPDLVFFTHFMRWLVGALVVFTLFQLGNIVRSRLRVRSGGKMPSMPGDLKGADE
jgi:hypothetical protein